MGRVVDLLLSSDESDDVDEYGHLVELGKIPKCPCCRRKVGQWTTTHILKFCEENMCDFWEENAYNLRPRGYVPYFDAFPECIEECLLMNYSATFVWRAVHKNLCMMLEYKFSLFPINSDVYLVIRRLLELPRAEKPSLKYDIETQNMLHVVKVIKRIKNRANHGFIRQILKDIRSKL